MGASRLFEILYMLLEKQPVTAKELAERLEVSVACTGTSKGSAPRASPST